MEILNISEIINLLVVLSIAASVAGFMAGLLGVGGGIIMVPALYYAFTVLDFDIATRMHLSVGTSLAIIIPTSVISSKTHMEYDAVDFKLVKSFGIFIVLGVIGGTFLAVNLKTSTFVLFFSVMAFIVGLFFIFFREKVVENPKQIKELMDEINLKRISSQPQGYSTGGSTFRNTNNYKAWELIKRSGMSDAFFGGAAVSNVHSNFLINTGNASASDFEALGNMIIEKVNSEFGILLDWEIHIIGEYE